MIDVSHLDRIQLLVTPPYDWPANRATCCSIRFTIAAWAARNGYRYEGRWVKR